MKEKNIKLEEEIKKLNEELAASCKKISDLEESLKTGEFVSIGAPYNSTLHYTRSKYSHNPNPKKSGNMLRVKEQNVFKTLHPSSKYLRDTSPYFMTSNSKAVTKLLTLSTTFK